MPPVNSPDQQPGARAEQAPPPSMVEYLDARRQPRGRSGNPARRQIPAGDLDLIVRRAAEIQNKRGQPGTQLFTEEEVIEIGRQVGLDPDHVRRAMAEVHAESLAPNLGPENRILDLLAGDAMFEVRRVIPGDPTAIQQQLEVQLREREKLGALRRRPLRSVWEASGGVMDRIERSLNISGKEYALAEARQVHLAVAEVEPGWSLVTLAADFGNKREEALYSVASGVAVAAILAAVFTGRSAVSFAILLGIGAALFAGLAGAAIGIPWLRRNMEKRRARIQLILEGLLDRVDYQKAQ